MSTPVQRQYWQLKNENPDALLFFRLGDFYELFFEDAFLASRVLGITQTYRHKGTENEMPMAGFPYHSHKEYLETLIKNGYKVAIAEQFEDPETKQISRKVVRVVTPGTTTEEGNLEENTHNFLSALTHDPKTGNFALAYTDISTGVFRTMMHDDLAIIHEEIQKISPKEIVFPQKLFAQEEVSEVFREKFFCTIRPDLNLTKSQKILEDQFQNLSIFGLDQISILLEASALVLDYLQTTQKTDLSHIQKIDRYRLEDHMHIDEQTFRHLEIFAPITQTPENKNATFASIFTRPQTAMGGRTLRQIIARPLLDRDAILYRQEAVTTLLNDYDFQQKILENFTPIPDLERILGRIVTGRANARDLVFFRQALAVFPEISHILSQKNFEFFQEKSQKFAGFEKLFETLQKSLQENPPIEITAGGMIQDGFDEKLDHFREISAEGKNWLDKFLEEKKSESGIQNLKIKYSKTFGFCLEVTKSQLAQVPESWVQRQTLVNASRYTTEELAKYETEVLSAESSAFARETEIFHQLREEIASYLREIQAVAEDIGEIDACLSLALTAQKNRWNCPEILKDTGKFSVKSGRHPVVESLSGESFIANDCHLSTEDRLHLITGPNMAGKSTYLRQNCLIILLAQIGSYVPAQSAKLSVFDRIFTRVGASDNLAGGQSTFFVEMTETASILMNATEKSFVILDEIGRGTSTFDGISLAWAITEFLHDKIKAKTLFATHYHELIDLGDSLSAASNFHVSATQDETGIIFLRKILPGGISDSFGIEVAKLAGLPVEVIKKSREVLQKLEQENISSERPTLFDLPVEINNHLSLQSSESGSDDDLSRRTKPELEIPQKYLDLEKKLVDLEINNLTPLQALQEIQKLKEKL